jgi:hypothetical protein
MCNTSGKKEQTYHHNMHSNGLSADDTTALSDPTAPPVTVVTRLWNNINTLRVPTDGTILYNPA